MITKNLIDGLDKITTLNTSMQDIHVHDYLLEQTQKYIDTMCCINGSGNWKNKGNIKLWQN